MIIASKITGTIKLLLCEESCKLLETTTGRLLIQHPLKKTNSFSGLEATVPMRVQHEQRSLCLSILLDFQDSFSRAYFDVLSHDFIHYYIDIILKITAWLCIQPLHFIVTFRNGLCKVGYNIWKVPNIVYKTSGLCPHNTMCSACPAVISCILAVMQQRLYHLTIEYWLSG